MDTYKSKQLTKNETKLVPALTRPARIAGVEIPEWWDCQWQRIPCNKKACFLCSKQEVEEAWDVIADARAVLEEVSVGALPVSQKRTAIGECAECHAPLKDSNHPMSRSVGKWADELFEVFMAGVVEDAWWLDTEAAAEVEWYAPVLLDKVGQQLETNAWLSSDPRNQVAEADHGYTRYVFAECLLKLERSLRELALYDSGQKAEFALAIARLTRLKQRILKL